MAKTRAERRNSLRRTKNSLARAKAAQVPHEKQRRSVRHVTQLRLLLGRNAITPEQERAGDRLYRDWRSAGREPRIVPDLLRTGGRQSLELLEHQADAERRYMGALRAVGSLLSPIVVHVCLLDGPASDWAKERGRPGGDGLAVLRVALDGLVAHYVACGVVARACA